MLSVIKAELDRLHAEIDRLKKMLALADERERILLRTIKELRQKLSEISSRG